MGFLTSVMIKIHRKVQWRAKFEDERTLPESRDGGAVDGLQAKVVLLMFVVGQ